MTPEELLPALFETMIDHLKLPGGYKWAPTAVFAVVSGFGLMLLLRGARWAPGLAGLTFVAISGLGGSFLARAIGTPFWPTVGVTGVVGLVLGLSMFRFWQAVLLAACCIIAGFSVYFVRTLNPEVAIWRAGLPESGVALQPAGTIAGENRPSAMSELNSLWQHLDANVPDFATTSLVLLLSTGLAGLVFGLLLPRASRALWAASLGTLIFGVGATALLRQFAPEPLSWLLADNMRAWGVVGAVWMISLALNLVTCRQRPAKKPKQGEAPAKNEPALA